MNIEIYGKANCGQCNDVKNYLDSVSVPYTYNELDRDYTKEELLTRFPTARMFPQIVADGVRVTGGLKQLMTMVMVKESVPSQGPSFLTE